MVPGVEVNLLIADPRTDGDATPAEAVDQAVHGVALAAWAVRHGDGAGAGSVEGRTEPADRVMASGQTGALGFRAVRLVVVVLVRGGTRVAVCTGLTEGRRQVGGLVLGRIGSEARWRRNVDGRRRLCHVSR